MNEPYELGTALPARRALADRLPPGVAAAAVEFITGPLLENPRQVGHVLAEELIGIHSARLGRDWRVFYEIDDDKRTLIVLDIRHRANAYPPSLNRATSPERRPVTGSRFQRSVGRSPRTPQICTPNGSRARKAAGMTTQIAQEPELLVERAAPLTPGGTLEPTVTYPHIPRLSPRRWSR